jgi:4'-phosphopantetheinyl transferase
MAARHLGREGDGIPFTRFGDFVPAANEVRVWHIEVPADCNLGAGVATLAEDERRRAVNFRTPALRNVFVAAHGALRHILATQLAVCARTLAFSTDEWGKPFLVHPPGAPEFNLSHSDNRILIAVSSAGPVGVDIEQIMPEAPYEIAPTAFTKNEPSLLVSLAPAISPEDILRALDPQRGCGQRDRKRTGREPSGRRSGRRREGRAKRGKIV